MPRWKIKSGNSRIAQAEQEQRALELRKQGYSLAKIGEELGLGSAGNAYKLIVEAIRKIPLEDAEIVRRIETERYDRMLRKLEDNLNAAIASDEKPDTVTRILDQMLRVSERRSKLLGLDAAQKFEVGTTVADYTPEQIVAWYRAKGRPMEEWPPLVQEYAKRLEEESR